jgi:hypothetical protein
VHHNGSRRAVDGEGEYCVGDYGRQNHFDKQGYLLEAKIHHDCHLGVASRHSWLEHSKREVPQKLISRGEEHRRNAQSRTCFSKLDQEAIQWPQNMGRPQ